MAKARIKKTDTVITSQDEDGNPVRERMYIRQELQEVHTSKTALIRRRKELRKELNRLDLEIAQMESDEMEDEIEPGTTPV